MTPLISLHQVQESQAMMELPLRWPKAKVCNAAPHRCHPMLTQCGRALHYFRTAWDTFWRSWCDWQQCFRFVWKYCLRQQGSLRTLSQSVLESHNAPLHWVMMGYYVVGRHWGTLPQRISRAGLPLLGPPGPVVKKHKVPWHCGL